MIYEIDVEEDFLKHFRTGGTTMLDCQCGREHHAMLHYDEWEWDQNPVEKDEIVKDLEERQKTDDNLHLHYDCDYIGVIEVGNAVFADSCPCKGWKPYMEFLIAQRREIAGFLIDVSKEIKRIRSYEDVMDVLSDEYLKGPMDLSGL